MKIKIDGATCLGCGACMAECPNAIQMNSDGVAVPKTPEVKPEDVAAAKRAADGCPVSAITIEE